ncbi:hypothetical protein D3C86_1652240 [compost metagenome]
MQGRAHDDVLDLGRIDADARDRVLHGVGAERLRLGVVEGPAIGPADRGAGGGDDDGFTHREVLSFWGAIARDAVARCLSAREGAIAAMRTRAAVSAFPA